MCVFFAHAGEMASVCDTSQTDAITMEEDYNAITMEDVEEEPFFPSSDCDQVCSVFFRTLLFTIDYHKKHMLINMSGTAASCDVTLIMVFIESFISGISIYYIITN